jgi:hypothetical protein
MYSCDSCVTEFLEWEMFQTNIVEEIKPHILSSLLFFFPESCAVYEIMWKNAVEPNRPQMTINAGHAVCMLNS